MFSHLKDVAKGKAKLFKKRSSKWPALRKAFLEGKACAACGSIDHLEAHHIVPFSVDPNLELSIENLIALCDKPGRDNCHLEIGHSGNYRNKNLDVVADAAKVLNGKK
jgi:5-methylcytosine-specific restriction endonuclease McrA